MKMVRGDIHEWREQSAVKGRGGATSLHTLYHRDVLGKHNAPGGMQALASLPIRIADGTGAGIKKLQSLPGLIHGLLHQQNDEEVVRLNAQQYVGVERQVLRGFKALRIPLRKLR